MTHQAYGCQGNKICSELYTFCEISLDVSTLSSLPKVYHVPPQCWRSGNQNSCYPRIFTEVICQWFTLLCSRLPLLQTDNHRVAFWDSFMSRRESSSQHQTAMPILPLELILKWQMQDVIFLNMCGGAWYTHCMKICWFWVVVRHKSEDSLEIYSL